ncbi:CPBP family intramembrane glutamic endopeptidase [Litorilituus lipolyticus]|nr:CPBP family intramembrane glutamic endopeptidase [Litorilituus lipolyticus]
MPALPELTPHIYPWLFLSITIIVAFVKPVLWPISFIVTVFSALVFNAINFIGLGIITLLFLLTFYAQKPSLSKWHLRVKKSTSIIVIISCVALAAHVVPGFNNLLVIDGLEKNINSVPFSMYLNFDKPMILFTLLLLSPTILLHEKPVYLLRINTSYRLLAFIMLSFIVIFSLGIALSLISFTPQMPNWWAWFAINNLLLTCVVEEVFFRGFIQRKLSQFFKPIICLIIASCLFGMAHFSGGFSYVIVATVAGFLYGFVYLNTGKLWHVILIHFGLNMTHLYLFTYPLLKS